MSVMYEVTGYDRKTDRLITFHDVPERRIASVKNIAGVPSSDDGLGSYPLNHDQVVAIARVLETPIDEGDLDFFLEAFDGNSDQSAAAS
jgi:hypothetical protein